MGKSRLIRTKITSRANLAEMDYRNKVQLTQEKYDSPQKWLQMINDGRLSYVPKLKEFRIYGRVLELGAGSAWLSSELSKFPAVKKVYCLDFSEAILSRVTPVIMKHLNADTTKITRIVGDFNKLEFKDSYFGFVFFDAALHHITDMDSVLSEIRRVLKPNGKLIAIREPVIPILRPWIKASFGKEDKEQGVTENIYTMKEWRGFFARNGLKLQFFPFLSGNRALFKILNKWPFSSLNKYLFAHFIFVAHKER
ncbi:MAG: methyltransferase domain-containing protein [Nanoarchaeota archaeon]|nr:methyltransferase domain-containing protein [Nanoarchaeota archaeon]